MPRRKRRRDDPPPEPASSRGSGELNAPRNSPFAEAAGLLRATVPAPMPPTSDGGPDPGSDDGARAANAAGEPPADSDADLFAQAVGPVRALPRRDRIAPARPEPITAPLYDEEAEALARLAAMVDGTEPLGHEFSEEHTEWIAPDADAGLLPRLVAGDFAVQAHLDLHGMIREQAHAAVVRFLANARVRRLRCVLVVHGRGHHSEGSIPVLKLALQRWLRRGVLRSWILAYATARPVDGGAGAMYVLLK